MRHSSFLEINLGLLQENVESIRALSKAEIIPMVKADAYGHGLVPISQFLIKECGLSKLGCASIGEALHVFQSDPSLKTEILVFSDTEIKDPEMRKLYSEYNITPVIHHISDLELVLQDKECERWPLVIKVNTGMNRLGLSLDELQVMAPRLKRRGVKHLLTHFACSYYVLKEGDRTYRQMDEFRRAKKILMDAGVEVEETSVSNSGAIEQRFGLDETYIRPGLMLYGPPSVVPRIWEGHQISRLVTKVLKTFSVKKGEPVGYGVNVAGEDGFIAVIPLGYGDGLMTYASGTRLTIKGMPAKIWARVNMDMAFLMFAPDADGKIKAGESIEIWNHDNQVISDIADQMKTIPYQLTCGISSRIPRIYKVR